MYDERFERWVISNYKPIGGWPEPPADWDPAKEVYVTFDGGETQYGPISREDIRKFQKSITRGKKPLEKKRKARTVKADGRPGLDMCETCLCYFCDGMRAFVKSPFRKKVERRRKEGVCPSCGKKPCKCKTNTNKKYYS